MTDDGRMVQEAGCMISALKSSYLNFCRVLYMVLHCDGGNWRYLCSLVPAEFFPLVNCWQKRSKETVLTGGNNPYWKISCQA